MRLDARTDGNQAEIIRALHKLGAVVEPIHMLGRGRPDLLVGYKGRNFLFELKDPANIPSKRKLTPDEKKWQQKWKQGGGQIATVMTIADILGVFHREIGG